MTAPFASLNGHQLTGGNVTVPHWGEWSGDVSLASDVQIPSDPFACTLAFGNLTLVGTAHRQGTFAGVTSVRLVAGGAGWRGNVPAQHYQASGGLLFSTLISDVAKVVGERVTVASDFRIGTDYVREKAAAREVIRQLFGTGWWIDPTGVTRFEPRPSAAITSAFDAEEWLGAVGRFSIATEDYAAWLPGATFSNANIPTAQIVSSTTFAVDNDGHFRLDVLSADPDDVDRIITPIDAVIRAFAPRTTYGSTYEYTVQSVSGGAPNVFVDVTPNASTTLPSLRNIRIRPGAAGEVGQPTVGAKCLVAFANDDPTMPLVFAVDAVDVATLDAAQRVNVGPKAGSVIIAGGSASVIPTPWATGPTGIVQILSTLASTLTGMNSLTGILDNVLAGALNGAGTALTTALGMLPSAATAKTKVG
jgi:hypothetical protein